MSSRLLVLLLAGFMLLSSPASPVASQEFPKADINRCENRFPGDALIEWDCVRLRKGQTLESLFGESWKDIARFNRIDRRHLSYGAYIKVPRDISAVKNYTPLPRIYPTAEKYPKFILVLLSEEFLGAYENGKLVFSSPIATGKDTNRTPRGHFRITAYDPNHTSSKYYIENTDKLYPMRWALRFFIDREGTSFWMHGRDLPGHPASHGCIGLYDEEMQKEYYGYPGDPRLEDAKELYRWAIGVAPDDGKFHDLEDGPLVFITDEIPGEASEKADPAAYTQKTR